MHHHAETLEDLSHDSIGGAVAARAGGVILFPTLLAPALETPAFDAAAQLAYLEKAFAPVTVPIGPKATPVAPAGPPITANQPEKASNPEPSRIKERFWQVIKIAIAVALIAFFGWRPAQRLLYATSAEAIVNARIVTLRAPIAGTVGDWASDVKVGRLLLAGKAVFKLDDAQADRSRVDDMRRALDLRQLEQRTAQDKLAMLSGWRAELANQVNEFRNGRLKQLAAREAEYAADAAAAAEREDMADHAAARSDELASRGVQSNAMRERTEADGKVAVLSAEAARKRLEGVRVELSATQRGFFVGDTFNDVPASAQKLRDVELMIAELKSKLTEIDASIAVYKSHLALEIERFDRQSTASIKVPADGRVWEMLTSPGEVVQRGQDLMRILDCRTTVVTAGVDEATYNMVALGSRATFRFRGETVQHEARVVGLNGLATVSSNFAIQQNSLLREPYHVTIELQGLDEGEVCRIGRTGTVMFGGATSGGVS